MGTQMENSDPGISRRQVLTRAMGAAAAATVTWFLPPELRKSSMPVALAATCWDDYSLRHCTSECAGCSGGYNEPWCEIMLITCGAGCGCPGTCQTLPSCGTQGPYYCCCMTGWTCAPC